MPYALARLKRFAFFTVRNSYYSRVNSLEKSDSDFRQGKSRSPQEIAAEPRASPLRMLIRRSLLLILAGVLAAAGTANLFAGDAADARRLLREVEGSEIFEKNLRVLCNEIGGRLPGTGAMSRAEQWALEAFREAGVGEVRLEPFPVPESWQEGDTEAEVTAPVRFAVRAAATAWWARRSTCSSILVAYTASMVATSAAWSARLRSRSRL